MSPRNFQNTDGKRNRKQNWRLHQPPEIQGRSDNAKSPSLWIHREPENQTTENCFYRKVRRSVLFSFNPRRNRSWLCKKERLLHKVGQSLEFRAGQQSMDFSEKTINVDHFRKIETKKRFVRLICDSNETE
jgi:hypothetical protein